MSKNIKNIIILVIILTIIAVAYFVFFGKTSSPVNTKSNSALQSSATGTAPTNSVVNPNSMTSAEATKISQEFVNQLLNLQAIKLNDDIFSSLAFQSLQDFSIVLVQPGNEGRPNPFAPFGADESNPDAGFSGDVVFTPGEAWPTVTLGNLNISYHPNWISVPINSVSANAPQNSTVIGYTFNLPEGFSITWGGPQSSCTSNQFGSFQYGVSTKVCLKNVTVQLNTQDAPGEVKSAFGELIQRNM